MGSEWQTIAFGSQTESLLWELFHENTKLSRLSFRRSAQEVEKYVAGLLESLPFDGYPTVKLPKRLPPLTMSIEQAMRSRTSAREMRSGLVRMEQLAAILYYGYGITRHPPGGPRALRTIPSAGALYPLEVFVQVRHVDKLAPGIYHYNPLRHHLRNVREGDYTDELSRCLIQHSIPQNASLFIFITALFERSTFKYGDRGYRFVLLEAGHVAQNINIVCTGFRLGSLNVGGFFDRESDAFLQLDGITHSNIYMVAIGTNSKPGSKNGESIRIGD